MVHWKNLPVGHLRYDIILLLRPESFKVLLSCANEGFCYSNLTGITKFKYERRNEKDSGRRSKITPSCKWPITCLQILLRGVGNHLTVLRPTDRPTERRSAPQGNQCLISHFLASLGVQVQPDIAHPCSSKYLFHSGWQQTPLSRLCKSREYGDRSLEITNPCGWPVTSAFDIRYILADNAVRATRSRFCNDEA